MTTKHINELLVLQLKTIATDVTRAREAIEYDSNYQEAIGALAGSNELFLRVQAALLTLRDAEGRHSHIFFSKLSQSVRERFELYMRTRREDLLEAFDRVEIDLDAEWRNFVADGNIDAEGNLVS